MPKALSDLRRRRIEGQLLAGSTPKEVAALDGAHRRTVEKIKAKLDVEEDMEEPKKPIGCPKAITPEMEQALMLYVLNRPRAYLEDMQRYIDKDFGVWIHMATISRTLKGLDITFKKLHYKAIERNAVLRNNWAAKCLDWAANQLIFVDETAVNEHTRFRQHGWAQKGINATEKRLTRRTERWSLLPAYTIDGIMTYKAIHGAFNQLEFDEFIERYVLPFCSPYPGPRSVIIADNASCHRSGVSIT